MIPIKLAVRNFMPYRDNVPPLSFTGIHIASICGDNGNGKSALIDAMTWALWGKTRAKSDNDLVHSGENETEVEFDFAVGQQTYRVIRKHAKPKRRQASGHTILDFQIATGNGFKSITGNSIQQTQQEIIKVLLMDYPTFINSAYLRQGHADEFTIARPAERKQVLADILGLSRYDELEEQARELAKQREAEKALAESTLKDIIQELALKPAYEAELEIARSELASIEKSTGEQEARLNGLRQKREQLTNKQQQLAQLEEHIAETTRARQHWDEQAKQHHRRIKEYEELNTRRTAIEENYTQLILAQKMSESLNQKLRLFTTLNEHKYQLEMAIVQASQTWLREHALTQNKIGESEATRQKLPGLKSELQQIQVELSRLTQEEEILSRQRQARQELATGISHLEAGKTRLEEEIKEIGEKLNLLLSEEGARCPLCETELGADGLKLIETKYTTDKQNKSDSLASTQQQLLAKRIELVSLEKEISRGETRLNQARTSAQSKATLLNQSIAEAEKASQKLDEARNKLAEIEERLAKKDFATGEQEALHRVEAEMAKLDYDPRHHEELRLRLSQLQPYELPKRRLEEADRLIEREREALTLAEQAAGELHHRLETDERKKQELATELSLLPRTEQELAQVEDEYRRLSTQQKQAQERVGNARGKLEWCTQLEITKEAKETRLNQVAKEEGIYRELAQAFGKTGIQALLIEMTLPEIEAEANRLLGRMTDNRMHVRIEPQRETRKGDVIETLDITIADELGARSYEMFSGGEAFRINFAIRIALSKLLARRAGAQLSTLIIDEGFGTQDSNGLEKLKEAIISIQDDFDKILVITHIEEFRDAFPNRIDVIKTAEGSTIEVS